MDIPISAAILSGGAAKRFGGITKANIVVGGRTIVSRILNSFSGMFDEIMIITNSPAEYSCIQGVRLVPDIVQGVGPLGGIHAALSASSSDAVFVVAGDMPLVNSALVLEQMKQFRAGIPDALIPRKGKYIEPLHSIYSKRVLSLLDDYLRKNRGHAVWEFITTLNAEYFEYAGNPEAANSFMNVNSPEDALLIEKIITGRG
ncbi:MAG TPA: molybdenum cofactor guanylyltransferase [Bacteroidales bacterium]|nr:molybdenum cofactor guanylyltransferase [Bacteroidales bacterium]